MLSYLFQSNRAPSIDIKKLSSLNFLKFKKEDEK